MRRSNVSGGPLPVGVSAHASARVGFAEFERSEPLYSRNKTTRAPPPRTMATTHRQTETDPGLVQRLTGFYRDYYPDDLAEFARSYPDSIAFPIDYGDLFQFDRTLAEESLDKPTQVHDHLVAALQQVPLPIECDFAEAVVPVVGLDDAHTYYPGEFSPTDHAGQYLAITGEVSKAADECSRIVEAYFECQRCGSLTPVDQSGEQWVEPGECQGCDRNGPFTIDYDESAFVDAQALRVKTPPEVAGGTGQSIDVDVEEHLTDRAEVGDRVTITGVLRRRPKFDGRQRTGEFEAYLDVTDVGHIAIEEADHTDIEIDPDTRARIRALADGAEGDPLALAADALAPKIHGHDHVKRMAILLMVGGVRVVHDAADDADRGDFHMLLIGDPSTGKSKLVDQVEAIAPRSVGVSGKGSSSAGLTASAVRDDFGDAEWSLEAGAFVQANEGVLCIDELDDMDADDRSALLEPMSKQSIHVSKAGINAHLATRAGVIAAANPVHGRFDPYGQVTEQFDFGSALLSRFDLVYTFTDTPDPDEDPVVADHILDYRDTVKRSQRSDIDLPEDDDLSVPIDRSILPQWVALAKRQPAPVFASKEVKDHLRESFVTLRGMNGYEADDPVPVAWRKLEASVRIAEAAARFELSDTIERRHVEIATEAIGQSMQDIGKNEDGKLDTDIQETGTSATQRDRIKTVEGAVRDLQGDYQHGVPIEDIVEAVPFDHDSVDPTIKKAKNEGIVIEPENNHYRWLGRY